MQTFRTERCLLHDLSFAPDGRRLLVGAQTRVLLDTLGTEPPVALKPPTGAFTAYAQLALGGTALVYTTPTDDVHVHVWDMGTGRVAVWEGVGRNVADLAVSPDGTTVYAAYVTQNGFDWVTEIRAFDVATGEPKGGFPAREGHFSWLTMSADGRRLAGRGSWSASVWDLTTPGAPESWVLEVRAGKIGTHMQGIALSASGTELATITSRGLAFWDVTHGTAATELFRSGKHKRRVSAVACCPTKPLLATGDTAGQVFLWDHTGRVLTRYDWGLGEVHALCFAPDGLRCAAADNAGKVVVWDVDV
jgi:WD40 repeat protein